MQRPGVVRPPPSPHGGTMHRRLLSTLLGASAAIALVATGCSDNSAADTNNAGAQTTSTTAPTAEANAWAVDYTGGTTGAADSSKPPVVIGYVNQEGGVPAFPEATAGTKAAVEYVNTELGGIDGHPLELKTCLVQAAEDGQKCGTEMVNDPNVKLVLTGVLTVGNDSLYKILVPKLPVIVGNP